jgi:hypothetical protein
VWNIDTARLPAASIAAALALSWKHAAHLRVCSCSEIDEQVACTQLAAATSLYAIWYTAFTVSCAMAARRAGRMRRLLNPVSTGAVVL